VLHGVQCVVVGVLWCADHCACVLQSVAVCVFATQECCSVLQCVAVCRSVLQWCRCERVWVYVLCLVVIFTI